MSKRNFKTGTSEEGSFQNINISSKVFEILDTLPKDFLSKLKEGNTTTSESNVKKEYTSKPLFPLYGSENNDYIAGRRIEESPYKSSASGNTEDWECAPQDNMKSYQNQRSYYDPPPGIKISSDWEVETPYINRANKVQQNYRRIEDTMTYTKDFKPSRNIEKDAKQSSVIPPDSNKGSKSTNEKTNMEKQKNILSKIWMLKEQKQKLEAQRNTVIASHKGDFKEIEGILEENCSLISEIDNQVSLLNKMVLQINGEASLSEDAITKHSSGSSNSLKEDDCDVNLSKRKSEPTLETTSSSKFLKPSEDSEKYSKKYIKSDRKADDSFKYKTNVKTERKKSSSESKFSSVDKEHKFSGKSHSKPTKLSGKSHPKPTSREERYSSDNRSSSKSKNSYSYDSKKSETNHSLKSTNDTSKFKEEVKLQLSSKSTLSSKKASQITEQTSFTRQMNICNEEIHWCKFCNFFSKSFGEYVKHLSEASHIIVMQKNDSNFTKKNKKEDFRPLPSDSLFQGTEFIQATTAYSCSICPHVILMNLKDVRNHMKSDLHASKYKEYILQNTSHEITYYKEKIAAYIEYATSEKDCEETGSTSKSVKDSSEKDSNINKKKESNISSFNSKKYGEKINSKNVENSSDKNLFPSVVSKKLIDMKNKTDDQFKSFLDDSDLSSHQDAKNKVMEFSPTMKTLNEIGTDDNKSSKFKEISNECNADSKVKKPLNIMIGKMPFLKRSKKLLPKPKPSNQINSDLSEAEKKLVELTSLSKKTESPNNAENGSIMPSEIPRGTEYITEIFNSNEETSFTKKIGPTLQTDEPDNEETEDDTNVVPMELCTIPIPILDNSSQLSKPTGNTPSTPIPNLQSYQNSASNYNYENHYSANPNMYQQANPISENFYMPPDYNSSAHANYSSNAPYNSYSAPPLMHPFPGPSNYDNQYTTSDNFHHNSYQPTPRVPPPRPSNRILAVPPRYKSVTTVDKKSNGTKSKLSNIDPLPPGTECEINSDSESVTNERETPPPPGTISPIASQKETLQPIASTELPEVSKMNENTTNEDEIKSLASNENELISVEEEEDDSLALEGLELLEDADDA